MNGFLKLLAEYSAAHPAGAADSAAATTVSAAEMFGPSSVAADPAVQDAAASVSLTSSPLFHCAVVVLLLWYMLSTYRHPELIRAVRTRILSPDTSSNERLHDDHSDAGYAHFAWSIIVAGVLCTSILLVKCAEAFLPEEASVPAGAPLWSAPVMAAVFVLTALYQIAVLWITGRITVSRQTVASLLYVKELYFGFALFLLTPALLLYALLPPGGGSILAAIVAAEVLLVAVLFLRETILLFVAKKVSILHWFLYLCTVEIFPVTFFCLAAVRF